MKLRSVIIKNIQRRINSTNKVLAHQKYENNEEETIEKLEVPAEKLFQITEQKYKENKLKEQR